MPENTTEERLLKEKAKKPLESQEDREGNAMPHGYTEAMDEDERWYNAQWFMEWFNTFADENLLSAAGFEGHLLRRASEVDEYGLLRGYYLNERERRDVKLTLRMCIEDSLRETERSMNASIDYVDLRHSTKLSATERDKRTAEFTKWRINVANNAGDWDNVTLDRMAKKSLPRPQLGLPFAPNAPNVPNAPNAPNALAGKELAGSGVRQWTTIEGAIEYAQVELGYNMGYSCQYITCHRGYAYFHGGESQTVTLGGTSWEFTPSDDGEVPGPMTLQDAKKYWRSEDAFMKFSYICYKWMKKLKQKEDALNSRLEYSTPYCFILGHGLIIGFMVLLFVNALQTYASIVFVIELSCSISSFFIVTYVWNGYALGLKHRIALGFFLSIPFIYGIIWFCDGVSKNDQLETFYGFTVSYMMVVLSLFLYWFNSMVSILKIERDAVAMPCTLGPFPLYQYNPTSPRDLVNFTPQMVMGYLSMLLLLIWGAVASVVLVKPFVGTAAISVALVGILLASLYAINTPAR